MGYGKLRHHLNEKLRQYGGHIGYIIRPTERGKVYGTILLSKLLSEARNKMIPEVLITCDEDNARSRRVSESNNKISSINKRRFVRLLEYKNDEDTQG